MGKDRGATATPTWRSAWERYAWVAGIFFVLALVANFAVASGVPGNQNDSAAKIANELNAHSTRLLVIAGVCVVYAAMFPIYLWKLYDVLRRDADRSPTLVSLVLVGGVLFVALHAVSDIAITGLVGAKLASYGALHDPGISYTLYLMTFCCEQRRGHLRESLCCHSRAARVEEWGSAAVACMGRDRRSDRAPPSGFRPRRRDCNVRSGS